MKNKTLIEFLQDLPEDYDVCFSKAFVVPMKDDDGKLDEYTVILDVPVVGIAEARDTKEIRFLVEDSKEDPEHKVLKQMGKILIEKNEME